uniref:KRAB domain-containing protein n=1 Tax=Pyxicephalus adspersus TaxID=30357 RepID=A0AAV2ZVD8_PYXAD|nr:TPA: hypothetical protein GDO54_004763 [Pyxicephalus adspersus]
MDKSRDHVSKKILKLTLKIIYLLTGEDYGPIKEQCVCSTPQNKSQSPIMKPPPSSLIPDRSNDQKILKVTNKIIELLTGEVSVRCQDVTVYFSMEEWEYLEEHKDLFENIMDDQQSVAPLGESSTCNTPEKCPSPIYAHCLENVVDVSQHTEGENSSITQDPKEIEDQGSINEELGVSMDCRKEKDHPLKSLKQDAGHISKDSRQDVGHLPNDKQEVDQIQKDCRQEIDLIRKICRQEVETILKDCKREIERIQKDCRQEINCIPRDCTQEAGHTFKDGKQEVEFIPRDCKQEIFSISKDCRQEPERPLVDCKLEVDAVLKDCKQEVDQITKDCRQEGNSMPKDCKLEAERNLKDCRWSTGLAQNDWDHEDEDVQQYYEEEQMKSVKIEILSDDEWDDEEWDDAYKEGESPIYINTDGSSGGNTPEKCPQNLFIDCREEDHESSPDFQRLARPQEKASSSLCKSNSKIIPKSQPDNGTTSTSTLNNNMVKRCSMAQRTFSPGQMELMTHFGLPSSQEHAQMLHHHQQQQQKNINTARKTTSDIQTLQNFLSEMNENRKIEEIPHTELDTLLSKFLLVVKRKDGNEYEPHTLRCMVGSIDRYLKEHNYMHTIVYGNSKDFPLTKQSLNAKIKFLKKIAESNPPIRQEALTDNDIENLYKSGTLSIENPTSLLNLVFFNNGIHFALRTKEQYNLQWGDIKLKVDPRGNQYLEYTDRQMEVVENRKNIRQVKPRMYATPHAPDRDPVTAFLKYRSFRPGAMMAPDAPFYLAPNINYNPAFSEWYRSTKIGIQKIRAMMTTMKIRASLPESKKKVGYITKKRLVERLPQHLLTGPSMGQAIQNNMHSGTNHPVATEVAQHKMAAIINNIPTSMASQSQDKMLMSVSSFHPRPSTSRYGEPPDHYMTKQ